MEEGKTPEYGAVQTSSAAWAMECAQGRQLAADVRLTMREDSPWGWCFRCNVYSFTGGEWSLEDTADDLGAQNADEALASVPWGAEGEVHRIDPDVLADAGLFQSNFVPTEPPRALTEDEIRGTLPAALAKAALTSVMTERARAWAGGGVAAQQLSKAQAERMKRALSDRETFSRLVKRVLQTAQRVGSDDYRMAANQVVSNFLLTSAHPAPEREAQPTKQKEPDRNSVFAVVPAKVGRDRESVRFFDVPKEDGSSKALAEVTLPHGTKVGGQDASFYRFVVSAAQIDAGGRDSAFSHSVLLPERNRMTGEPWKVMLTRDFGARDRNGVWQADKRSIVCTSTELRESCKEQYREYRARQQQRRMERPGAPQRPQRTERTAPDSTRTQPAPAPARPDAHKGGGCDLEAEAHEARDASESMIAPTAQTDRQRS